MLTRRVDLIYHAMRKIENFQTKLQKKIHSFYIMIISVMLATFQKDDDGTKNMQNEEMKIFLDEKNAKKALCHVLFYSF